MRQHCNRKQAKQYARWISHQRSSQELAEEEAARAAQVPQVAESESQPRSEATGAAGGLPACTWQPESGGNWNAVNPSSGAAGKYQVLPQTHEEVCPGLGMSPGEQEACAAKIWAQQGRSAWVNC